MSAKDLTRKFVLYDYNHSFWSSGATHGLAEQNVSLPKQTHIESNVSKGGFNGQSFVRSGSGPAIIGGPTPSVGSVNGTTVRLKRN